MNNTFNAIGEEIAAQRRTGTAQIRAAVSTDLARTPEPGQSLPGAQSLLAQTMRRGNGAYFKSETLMYLTAGIVLALAAAGVWLIAGESLWSRLAALALGTLGSLNLYRALTLPAPAHLSAERLALAHQRPVDAGDEDQKPMGLAHLVVIGLVVLGDAALAGSALLSVAMGSNLNSEQVLGASIVWACAFSFLLYKLVQAAAREQAINRARRTIHRLLSSSEDEDRQRGHRMKREVGGALDHDVTRTRDRIRARVALWSVVALMTVSVFIARLNAETAPLDLGGQAPAMLQPAQHPAAAVKV